MSSGYGMAASIVGTELQGWAALLDKWAMGDTYRQQQQEQNQFRQAGQNLINQRIQASGFNNARQEMAQGQQQREQGYQQVENQPFSLQGPTPIPGQEQKRNQAYTNMLGAARAKLGSYGDWLQQQWLANQGYNRGLGQLSNFAAGTESVFPLQMYKAQHSMDALSAIGQAISSLGGGSTNFGSLWAAPSQGQTSLSAPNFNFSGVSGGTDLPDVGNFNDLGAATSVSVLG